MGISLVFYYLGRFQHPSLYTEEFPEKNFEESLDFQLLIAQQIRKEQREQTQAGSKKSQYMER